MIPARYFVLALLIFSVSTLQAQQNLLSGKWQLTFDPDGPVVDDWMEFHPNGKVDFGDGDGVYLNCDYSVGTNRVVASCEVRGNQVELVLEARDSFKQLVNPSGAIYSKQ